MRRINRSTFSLSSAFFAPQQLILRFKPFKLWVQIVFSLICIRHCYDNAEAPLTRRAFLRQDLESFFYSRSYQARKRAPRKSTPSVSKPKASGVSLSLAVWPWVLRGQLKVPFSNRLVKTQRPVPSK